MQIRTGLPSALHIPTVWGAAMSHSSVFERKRCGDKVRLCFSQRKKARTPGFNFELLESGEYSVCV